MGLRDLFGNALTSVADAITDRLDLVKGEDLIKSQPGKAPAGKVPPEPPEEGPDSILWDPFALLETLGYRERYSMVSYDALQKLAYRVPIFPAIKQIRQKQVLLFSQMSPDENEPGFQLRLREKEKTPSKKQKIRMQELEEWVVNTGSSSALIKDGFGSFLQKFTGDSLVYDQGGFEIVRNNDDVPADFYAVDGASFRIVDQPWEKNVAESDDMVRYVQVHDASVVNEFTPKQLCFAIRNPRTDLRCNGYGLSELEMGVNICTSLIFGFEYNKKFFSQGTVAKGMLNVPQVPDKRLRIFAQQWHMIVSGITNAWRTPITNFPDAKWIDLQKTNRDMEWGEWTNFNIKLLAGLNLIDPTEFGFIYGNTGQQAGSMFQAGTENRVKHSKDKGLRPLLMFVAEQLNRYLIWQIDPELELVFTGLDPKEAKQEVDIQKTQTSYLMTVDEQRKRNDLPPMKGGLGDVILDPNWIQFKNAKDQAEQMEQQMEMGGGEMGPGGEEGPGGAPEGGEAPEEEGMDAQGWESMMREAEKADDPPTLRKAHVRERREGDVIEYDIDL